VVTDERGDLVEKANNLPYGAIEADANEGDYTGYREPYQFTGKERDDDFGLVYFGARYLNPAIGRWMSPDPLYLLAPEKCLENSLVLPLALDDGSGPVLAHARRWGRRLSPSPA